VQIYFFFHQRYRALTCFAKANDLAYLGEWAAERFKWRSMLCG